MGYLAHLCVLLARQGANGVRAGIKYRGGNKWRM